MNRYNLAAAALAGAACGPVGVGLVAGLGWALIAASVYLFAVSMILGWS